MQNARVERLALPDELAKRSRPRTCAGDDERVRITVWAPNFHAAEALVEGAMLKEMCIRDRAAADPLLEPLLISWGLEEFSMSAPSILRARKTISQWTKAECDELAEKALACNTAAEVKALLESAAR